MTYLTRNKIDPTKYWEEDGFLTYQYAEEIAEVYDLATTVEDDRIYWHNGRTWHRFGDQQLRGEIRAMLRDRAGRDLVNEVVRNVRHLTRTPREDIFDLPPEKLVVENGTVDLIEGEYSHGWDTPGTHLWVPVEYEEGVYPDAFNTFLFNILHPDDVKVMWELIGYCLYRGYPIQTAALFLGDGANGKSTLLNAIQEFLGPDNVAAKELHELAGNKFAAADLVGKLANIGSDLSSEELENTSTFKELTGEDPISAERKHKDPFKFKNQATLLFSANQAPAADDGTYAYERRWLYFDFPHTFGGKPCGECGEIHEAAPQRDLLDQFHEEHVGILNMAIEAFGDLWERGHFPETVYQKLHDDAHDRATNSAYTFAVDEIEPAEGEVLRQSVAVDAFQLWAEESGRPVQGPDALKKAVRKAHAPDEGKDPSDKRFDAWFDVRLVGGDGGDGDGSADGSNAGLGGFGA